MSWFDLGCEQCREATLTPGTAKPRIVGRDVAGCAILRQCEHCGAWWREGPKETHVISDEEARRAFPQLIKT